jgi:hypothetical protein
MKRLFSTNAGIEKFFILLVVMLVVIYSFWKLEFILFLPILGIGMIDVYLVWGSRSGKRDDILNSRMEEFVKVKSHAEKIKEEARETIRLAQMDLEDLDDSVEGEEYDNLNEIIRRANNAIASSDMTIARMEDGISEIRKDPKGFRKRLGIDN